MSYPSLYSHWLRLSFSSPCDQWAGTALAVPEHREDLQLDAVNEYADGICTNFHKWGLVAFDCSALWVRDRKVLTNALDVTPAFLRTKHGDTGLVVDYRNWSLSVSVLAMIRTLSHHRMQQANWATAIARATFPFPQTLVRSAKLRSRRVPCTHPQGKLMTGR